MICAFEEVMKIHVRTLSIDPCGCGHEGSIQFELPDSGTNIRCSYTSMNDEVVAGEYEIGAVAEAPIYMAFGAMKRTSECKPSLSPSLVGQFAGWVEIGDEVYGIVDGLVRIPVDNDLGEPMPDLEIGEWVECTGELMLGCID